MAWGEWKGSGTIWGRACICVWVGWVRESVCVCVTTSLHATSPHSREAGKQSSRREGARGGTETGWGRHDRYLKKSILASVPQGRRDLPMCLERGKNAGLSCWREWCRWMRRLGEVKVKMAWSRLLRGQRHVTPSVQPSLYVGKWYMLPPFGLYCTTGISPAASPPASIRDCIRAFEPQRLDLYRLASPSFVVGPRIRNTMDKINPWPRQRPSRVRAPRHLLDYTTSFLRGISNASAAGRGSGSLKGLLYSLFSGISRQESPTTKRKGGGKQEPSRGTKGKETGNGCKPSALPPSPPRQ